LQSAVKFSKCYSLVENLFGKKSRIYKILNHTFKSLASQELEKKIKVVSKRRSELLIAREMDKAQQQKAEVSVTLTEKCVVPENIHTHTKEG